MNEPIRNTPPDATPTPVDPPAARDNTPAAYDAFLGILWQHTAVALTRSICCGRCAATLSTTSVAALSQRDAAVAAGTAACETASAGLAFASAVRLSGWGVYGGDVCCPACAFAACQAINRANGVGYAWTMDDFYPRTTPGTPVSS